MGLGIRLGRDWILRTVSVSWQRQVAGGLLTVVLMGMSYGYAAGAIAVATLIHPLLGVIVHGVLLASCLGARGLRLAALSVLQLLRNGDLQKAREQVGLYVGRDTEALDASEICRALVETVAENTPDGGTAPLFYAVVGGAPLAFAYKSLSTLDSMVGYRREPYRDLGRFPARLEDAATWLPCRLTVLTLACFSAQPFQYLDRCARDARQDPSPNSGWSEAAFAWLLGVQLGGRNVYGGVVKEKPLLGRGDHPLDLEVVQDSVGWLRRVMVVWGLVFLGGYGVAALGQYWLMAR